MRIALVGNCQAIALAELIDRKCEDIEVLSTKSVHSLEPPDEEAFLMTLRSSDAVFTQPVSDDFPQSFCRTSTLRHLFQSRVTTFANLYFSGYDPTMGYLRCGDRHLDGPIGGNHIAQIYEAFKRGLSPSDACQSWRRQETRMDLPLRSVEELRRRDLQCDIPIGVFVADTFKHKLLFHTVNHPTTFLLDELANRIVAHCGYRPASQTTHGEIFGDLSLAVHPGIVEAYKITFFADNVYRGFYHTNGVRTDFAYGIEDLTDRFYALYASTSQTAWEHHPFS